MMKPKPYSPDKTGRFMMIYGDTKVGKTVNTLKTAPLPIDYIRVEKRSLTPSVEAAERPELLEPGNLNIWDYENFESLIELVSQDDPFSPGSTIITDSASALMGVDLLLELANEAFEKRKEDDVKSRKKTHKQLVNKTKMSEEAYGALGANMIRYSRQLQRLSTLDHLVIMTAQIDERPKWNRALSVGPLLAGKMFGDNSKGFFDYIGFVQHNTITKGGKKQIVYPPRISFESPDESFLCAWTGKKDKPMVDLPFDLGQILK